MAGSGSYKTPDAADCEIPGSCDVNPVVDETCVYIYSECNYAGTSTKICGDTPFTDIDYVAMSVKIPDNEVIYLYNMPCFNGNTVQLSESVDCLEEDNSRPFDFSLLGIKLVTEEKQMKEHPSAFVAKYRQPSLRKAALKSFKK